MLKNCAIEFYSNCAAATLKCKDCVAGSGNKALYYEPYADLATPHPLANWKATLQAKKKVQQQAKQTEKRIAGSIARKTMRSGAANHDGDLLVNEAVRVEIKRRGSRKSWNVTTTEYDKGIKQGIEVFAIEIQREDTLQPVTLYCCTEDFFSHLLAAAGKKI